VTTATRAAVLPDVPAMAEFLPGYEASIYVGIAAPRGTPADIVETLNMAMRMAIEDAAMKKRIAELGDTPLSLSTSDFAKLVDDETEKWRKVIQTAHLRAD
jgi:tripartite-type tricarboxylate transporter receptor subunit TctC